MSRRLNRRLTLLLAAVPPLLGGASLFLLLEEPEFTPPLPHHPNVRGNALHASFAAPAPRPSPSQAAPRIGPLSLALDPTPSAPALQPATENTQRTIAPERLAPLRDPGIDARQAAALLSPLVEEALRGEVDPVEVWEAALDLVLRSHGELALTCGRELARLADEGLCDRSQAGLAYPRASSPEAQVVLLRLSASRDPSALALLHAAVQDSSSAQVRGEALRLVVRHEAPPVAASLVLRALADPDLRRQAARLSPRLREGATYLLEAFHAEGQPKARRAMATGLLACPGGELLVSAAALSASPSATEAVQALGALADSRTESALRTVLTRGLWEPARQEALVSLDRVGKLSRRQLEGCALADRSALLRETATAALGREPER